MAAATESQPQRLDPDPPSERWPRPGSWGRISRRGLGFFGTGACALAALDDGGDAHTAADAQRDQRGGLVGALWLVERRRQQDRAGGSPSG